jgi:hypothetical protein
MSTSSRLVLVIVCGLACTALSVLLAGAGHGWMAPLVVSWIAVPAGVTAVLAARAPRSKSVTITLLTLGAIALGCDAFLFGLFGSEDFSQAAHGVWAMAPLWAGTWAVTWVVWQIIAVAAIALRAKDAT